MQQTCLFQMPPNNQLSQSHITISENQSIVFRIDIILKFQKKWRKFLVETCLHALARRAGISAFRPIRGIHMPAHMQVVVDIQQQVE